MELTQSEIERFNFLYEAACKRLDGLILLGDYRQKSVGFFVKRRANKTIKTFNDCLSISPEHVQTLFFLGKIYQRLGDHETALNYMEKAMELEGTNPNIPQEASLEAMHLGKPELAVQYSQEAVRRSPEHFAILGNHAMTLLIGKKDEEARQTIDRAISINPNDQVNLSIRKVVYGVTMGEYRRPTFKDSINFSISKLKLK